MASADSYRFNRIFRSGLLVSQRIRQASPGKDADFPSIYPPHLLLAAFGDKDFALSCKLIQLLLASMWFLYVGPEVCRRLLSDSPSPGTPLP